MRIFSAITILQAGWLASLTSASIRSAPEINGVALEKDYSECSDHAARSTGCTFHQTSNLITSGGTQMKASQTVVCNVRGGCVGRASASFTSGYTFTPPLSDNLAAVISAGVGYPFTKSIASNATDYYSQVSGVTGYMTYIPTNYCWNGTFSGCAKTINGNVMVIDPTEEYQVCTPALLEDGTADGTFSFVFIQN